MQRVALLAGEFSRTDDRLKITLSRTDALVNPDWLELEAGRARWGKDALRERLDVVGRAPQPTSSSGRLRVDWNDAGGTGSDPFPDPGQILIYIDKSIQLHAPAYNLATFMRCIELPEAMADWSLTSQPLKLINIGARVFGHARAVIFQLDEVAVTGEVVRAILAAICRIRAPPSCA